MTHPPCGIVAFTGHVIRSNQGLSLDDKGGKEKEPGCKVDFIQRNKMFMLFSKGYFSIG